ncbi:MAG: hypothetical protein JXR75_12700 [Rhodobacteraceae bacterium]|nr:hypothetical protein [Paracoccaceae bacterium]
MRLKPLPVLLAVAALVAGAATGLAQDRTGINIDPVAIGTPGAVTAFVLAQDLYRIGLAGKDALMVLTAARLAASADMTEGKAGVPEIKKQTTGKATSDDAGAADTPLDAAAMMAQAKELAGEDETILALIDLAEVEGVQGGPGGAIRRLSHLPAGMTDVWEVPFAGHSLAEVAVVGDGDANLDVRITDENGNPICIDVSGSDRVICDFVPAWNGYFQISVHNTGDRRNSYHLITN